MNGEYKKIFWTEHVKLKMQHYGLSKGKLLKLLRKPQRKEQGIAPKTVAVMQSNASYKTSKSKIVKPLGEIWLMYQDDAYQRKIISAWRYPGISKPGESVPIPAEILRELQHEFSLS